VETEESVLGVEWEEARWREVEVGELGVDKRIVLLLMERWFLIRFVEGQRRVTLYDRVHNSIRCGSQNLK
jgi:hypothetical protein